MRESEARSIVRRRQHEQRLAGSARFPGPVAAVRALVAVQGQELPEAKWALGQRTGCDDTQVEEALASGALVRTHVPRPTWHLIASQDVRMVLRVLGPRVHVANRHVYKQCGIDADTAARTQELLAGTLADGEPRTRSELAAAMAAGGVTDVQGIRLAHVLMRAELDALVISGPRRGRQQTYQLLDHRVPSDQPRTVEQELAELVRRWFVGHGPATVRDFAWWSGLTLAEIRRGLAALAPGALEETIGDDGARWYAAPEPPAEPSRSCGVRLLGAFDESIIAYRNMRAVPAEAATRIGEMMPVLADGRVVGGWRRSFSAREVWIEVRLDEPLNARRRSALNAEARRYAAYFGRDLELTVRHDGT